MFLHHQFKSTDFQIVRLIYTNHTYVCVYLCIEIFHLSEILLHALLSVYDDNKIPFRILKQLVWVEPNQTQCKQFAHEKDFHSDLPAFHNLPED